MASGNDFFALILMVVILTGVIVFITQPLLRRRPEMVLENYFEETPMHELLGRKDALYQSIKDLEFDFKTAKLSEDDYIELRDKMEGEAVKLLKRIDDFESKSETASLSSISKPAAKKAVIKAVCPGCGEPYGKGIKFCPGCGQNLETLCDSCGHEYKPEDKFCPGCGGQLLKIKA